VVEDEFDRRVDEEGEERGGFENVGWPVKGVPGGVEHWWVTDEAPVWSESSCAVMVIETRVPRYDGVAGMALCGCVRGHQCGLVPSNVLQTTPSETLLLVNTSGYIMRVGLRLTF
jgi:hypothetical protein